MDIIASPTTVTFTTQFGAPAPGASPAEIIEAKVMQILADGRARLAVANTLIDVATSVPLVVGSTVRLAVKHTPDGIRLALIDPTLTGGKPMPLAIDPGARAALTAALPGHTGSTATHAPATATTPPHDLPHLPSPPLSPAQASAVALANAVRGAAARQNGLAPLFADLAVAVRSPDLPQAARAAVAQVLALRLPVADGVTPEALKQGFQRSGLFLEAGLASERPEAVPAGDLKAALLALRQMLKGLAGAEAGKAGLSDLLPSLPTAAATAAATASEPRLPVANPSVPPPYRGAPTAAQAEAAPAISSDLAADDIVPVLLRDTEAAVGRQTLLQAASLPERPNTGHSDPANGPRWHFEIPMQTPQGTTLAQFEIARDGHNAPAESYKAIWRARFSVDVEPLGAIHAQVALIGSRAAVTLWAERPEAAARMREDAATLKTALTDAAFEPDILVRDGTPPRPREAQAPAGRFLDRAS